MVKRKNQASILAGVKTGEAGDIHKHMNQLATGDINQMVTAESDCPTELNKDVASDFNNTKVDNVDWKCTSKFIYLLEKTFCIGDTRMRLTIDIRFIIDHIDYADHRGDQFARDSTVKSARSYLRL